MDILSRILICLCENSVKPINHFNQCPVCAKCVVIKPPETLHRVSSRNWTEISASRDLHFATLTLVNRVSILY